MRYMLDTNVAIHTIRHRPREVRAKFIAQQGRMCISTVSLMELIYGAEKSTQPDRNLRDVEAFASRLRILPYEREAAMHTASIRAALARVGTPIGPYDQMIAGHARRKTGGACITKRVPPTMADGTMGARSLDAVPAPAGIEFASDLACIHGELP